MLIQIKNTEDDPIFTGEFDTLKEAVECAVGDGVSLAMADLINADLEGANLQHANLQHANLQYANLWSADLWSANLCGANLQGADLQYANLQCANLRGANLQGAKLQGANLQVANLQGANLQGAKLDNNIPVIANIHNTIYAATSQPGALDMGAWHSCETTHCRAGWVIILAGEEGKQLETLLTTPTAAALIYAKSDPDLDKIPDFYADDKESLADMKNLAQESNCCN